MNTYICVHDRSVANEDSSVSEAFISPRSNGSLPFSIMASAAGGLETNVAIMFDALSEAGLVPAWLRTITIGSRVMYVDQYFPPVFEVVRELVG